MLVAGRVQVFGPGDLSIGFIQFGMLIVTSKMFHGQSFQQSFFGRSPLTGNRGSQLGDSKLENDLSMVDMEISRTPLKTKQASVSGAIIRFIFVGHFLSYLTRILLFQRNTSSKPDASWHLGKVTQVPRYWQKNSPNHWWDMYFTRPFLLKRSPKYTTWCEAVWV